MQAASAVERPHADRGGADERDSGDRSRIPTIYPFRSFVEAGGLMAYGNDLVEIFHQAARVIDQILKGAKPADIPFYQPTKFELVINRTAAKETGLVVSEPLLARADEVIE
jgi:putative tryptophan/tyrosine transport system substrate-binding protein